MFKRGELLELNAESGEVIVVKYICKCNDSLSIVSPVSHPFNDQFVIGNSELRRVGKNGND